MGTGLAENSRVQRHQTSIPMRFGARLAGTKFTLLAGLGATGGTTNCQRFLLRGLHDAIMPRRPPARWSILTTTFTENSIFRGPYAVERPGSVGTSLVNNLARGANHATQRAPICTSYSTLPCGGKVKVRESARPISFRSHKSRSLYFVLVKPRSFHS